MPRKPVSVGIHVPSASTAPLGSGADYAEFFRQVEALGLDAVWTEDRLFHSANLLDSVTLLAWAAANTRRIQLGTAVLVLNLRHAAVVARQVSTLTHLSGGRLAHGTVRHRAGIPACMAHRAGCRACGREGSRRAGGWPAALHRRR